MEALFKSTEASAKATRADQATAHELRPWLVSEGIREHFRKVRTTLDLSHQTSLCVAVGSTSHGEGASWVTAMLSCAIAEETDSIFLVDCARSHPSQNIIFGVDENAGVLVPESEPVNLISRRAPRFDICILTPETGSSSGQKFASSLRDTLPNLRRMARVILIDCEPMQDSSQLLDLAPAMDGVIFVVEAERERRETVARSIASIKRAGLRVFGVVLNKRKRYIPGWLYRAL
jgi:Mrp family chromosome partitioning ATPase